MNGDKRIGSLETALRHLAGETADARPPARIEAELKAQVRRHRPARIQWWALAATAAAVCVAGFWTMRDGGKRAEPAPIAVAAAEPAEAVPAPAIAEEAAPVARPAVMRTQAPSSRGSGVREASALTPWFFSDGLPMPARGQVVSIRVSAATAGRFGVVADGPVPAQLLIGDDGLTRAIRFVRE